MSSDYEEDSDDECEDFDPNKPLEPYAEMDSEDERKAEKREKKEKKRKEKVSTARVRISCLVPKVFSLLDGRGWHSIADDQTWR